MSTSESASDQQVANDLFLRYLKEVSSGGEEAFEALCKEHPGQASYLHKLFSAYRKMSMTLRQLPVANY